MRLVRLARPTLRTCKGAKLARVRPTGHGLFALQPFRLKLVLTAPASMSSRLLRRIRLLGLSYPKGSTQKKCDERYLSKDPRIERERGRGVAWVHRHVRDQDSMRPWGHLGFSWLILNASIPNPEHPHSLTRASGSVWIWAAAAAAACDNPCHYRPETRNVTTTTAASTTIPADYTWVLDATQAVAYTEQIFRYTAFHHRCALLGYEAIGIAMKRRLFSLRAGRGVRVNAPCHQACQVVIAIPSSGAWVGVETLRSE
ncbi:hypothetical protein EV126DRAFT_213227 [Verticillium dahliae]|nr:hypothetical protein EV126DRAFT_213227 [Verticillium dahliae]